MYKYFMGGMFNGTDGEQYDISIPAPFVCETEDEAVAKNGCLGYRFVDFDGHGPIIVIFEHETAELAEDKKSLNVRVGGTVVKTYTFAEFAAAGGVMRALKPECRDKVFLDGNNDFVDTDKSFVDVFPDMQKQKLYYIDNESYYTEFI